MVKDLKYILKRILIGVGIALIMFFLKDKSFLMVDAKTATFYSTPTYLRFCNVSGSCVAEGSNYTYLEMPFFGYSGTGANNQHWQFFEYSYTVPSTTDTGHYDLSMLFVQSSYNALADKMTVQIYDPTVQANYSCVSNDSNIGTNAVNQGALKHIVNIRCENVFQTQSRAYNVKIFINEGYTNTASTWLLSRITGSRVPSDLLSSSVNETNNKIQETNDTLQDSSIDESSATSSINTLNSKNASNNSITQLLTLPITLFQSILNSVNGSCSAFNLGNLLGTNLTMPCINLQNILGSTLYGIIDILLCGLFILAIRKKMVDIFNHMTSLNDRGNELE